MRRQLTRAGRRAAVLLALFAGALLCADDGRAGGAPGYHIYVVEFRAGYISVIDSGTRSEIRRIELGALAHPVEMHPSRDGRLLYVCNRGLDEIAVVDIKKALVVSRIKVGLHPHYFGISPDGKYLVVANLLDTRLSVVDLETQTVVARPRISDTDSGAAGVAFTDDGAFAYVPSIYTGLVYVIDMKKMKVVEKVPAPYSLDTEIPPGGRLAYFASHKDRLSILDTSTNEIAGEISLGYAPSHVTLSRDGRLAFVPNLRADYGWVVDLAAKKVTGRFAVGHEPLQSALSPDGRFLFVANYSEGVNTGSISIVDAESFVEVDKIKDLPFPRALAVLPAE